MSYIKFPFILPFKFVKWKSTGIHFDDKWTRDRTLFYERPVYYKQKWKRSVTTTIQVEAGVAPEPIEYYNGNGDKVKQTNWAAVFLSIDYGIYEVEIDFSDLPPHTYFLYQKAVVGAVAYEAITEPILVADDHRNILMFEYSHHFNDYDIAWTTGLRMKFFIEAGITDFSPEGEVTEHVNQTNDISVLNAVPSRSFKLLVGDANGIPPYALDILARIFKCSRVVIEGMRYARVPQSEIEKNFIKGNHLMGAAIEIAPAFNNQSLEFNSENGELLGLPGIVTAYNIQTAFFGTGTLVPITDIEKQG